MSGGDPIDDSHPLPPMAGGMKVDLTFNEDGGVWLLHDQKLPVIVKWAEYDAEAGTLTLMDAGGRALPVGLELPPQKTQPLLKATEITVLLTQNGEILDAAILPLNIIGS